MLNFKKYIDSRDLWLEKWIMECGKYMIESPGFDINIERTIGMKSMAAFKKFLQKVADNYGFSGFDFNSPKKPDRLGAGRTTIEDFKELMAKALGGGVEPTIVDQSDSKEIAGVKYTNTSKQFLAIPVVGAKIPFLMKYAGLDKRSGNTRLQEISFLYMLASKYYPIGSSGGSIVNENQFDHVAKYVEEKGKSFTAGDKTTKDVYEFLTTNSDWKTHWNQATDTFIKKFPSTPIKFVKDSPSFELNKQAERLFIKDKLDDELKWDSDKWNPADVWICYQNEDDIAGEFNGIKDFNRKMKEYLDSKNSGIIGLSLKKGSNYIEVNPETGGYEILDNKNSTGVKDPEIENGFKLYYGKFFGQSVNQALALLDYEKGVIPKESRHEIVYRLFTSKAGGSLVGEVKVKGTKAAHGKVYLEYIDVESGTTKISSTVKRATSKNVVEYDSSTGRYILTKDGRRIFKVVSFMWDQLKIGIGQGIVSSKIRSNRKERVTGANHLERQYSILNGTKEDFNDFLNGSILQSRGVKGKSNSQIEDFLNIKVATRFQTIAFGGWWCRIYSKNRKLALSTALGMMHLAKSMNPRFSAPHAKIT